MGPSKSGSSGNMTASNNLYTVILGFALCLVLATAAFVTYNCYIQYGTIFKIPS